MAGSRPEYGIVASHDVMVEMRDGVRLATDIYRPAGPDGSPVEGRFPTLLGRTSYDKRNPVLWVEPVARFFTRHGYVTVVQDLRGRGGSQGVGQYFHCANVNEGRDGYDTIEWIAAQPWSSGRVGMTGSSHGGIVQNMAALYRPPHLTALWVDVTPVSAFARMSREGGAMALHMYAALYLHAFDAPEIRDDPVARRRIERGAENLREELRKQPFRPGHTPIAAVPNLEEVLFHYYREGGYTDFWRQECVDQTGHWDRFADIPAVFSSGWYDPFATDAAEQFLELTRRNAAPQRLLLGPWNHGGMRGFGSTHLHEVDFGPDARWGDEVYCRERLRWFDRWLKDIDTGVEADAPVRLFVMGGGDGGRTEAGRLRHGGRWRGEDRWPPAAAVATPYYLRAGGALSPEPPEEPGETVCWTHDPRHPVPTLGGAVAGFFEWIELPPGMDRAYLTPRARMHSVVPDGPLHQRERPDLPGCRPPYPLMSERADVLVFQTPPLAEDIEVTGPIEVRLHVSSSAPDSDITAKLLDIHPPCLDWPQGFHMPLCDSILRLRFREGFDREVFMTPDTCYAVTVRLPPISNLFAAGHRIRLDIASSNFPRFDVNPNTGEPLGRHAGMANARNCVHLSPERASQVVLPIVGGSWIGRGGAAEP